MPHFRTALLKVFEVALYVVVIDYPIGGYAAFGEICWPNHVNPVPYTFEYSTNFFICGTTVLSM